MLGIILAILAGLFIIAVLALTFTKWRDKINKLAEQKRAKKVVSSTIRGMIKASKNNMSLDALNAMEDYQRQGYTHVMAATDENGNVVDDVELIKDTANDSEVKRLHGEQGYIVVNC